MARKDQARTCRLAMKSCMDCNRDTTKLKEHFYVKKEIWGAAHNSERGFLCVECLEGRLKRRLCKSDFTEATINNPRQKGVQMSALLLSRINGLVSPQSSKLLKE